MARKRNPHYSERELQRIAYNFLVDEWIDDGLNDKQAKDVAKMQVYGCQKMNTRDLKLISDESQRRN